MSVAYTLTPDMRRELKEPLGILIRGSFFETMNWFRNFVEQEKPFCVISVGDTVSRNLMKNGIKSNLAIVDNLAMRKATKDVPLKAGRIVHVVNPAGTITTEAVVTVKDALESNEQTVIVVDGEEDLLTLIAVSYAPENSVVLYGQPYEGIVVVKVTSIKKIEIERILKIMEIARKAK
jgi:uncharacterized protein (UPF0218 family)